MNSRSLVCLLMLSVNLSAQNETVLGPNSWQYEKIPVGEISNHVWHSQIYPGTVRNYYLYVPQQYRAEEPAALMIFQDGHAYLKEDGHFRVPTVFDNLIAQEKMPVTIGLFIDPGHDTTVAVPDSPWRVTNRSLEYDELSNTYSAFLIKELIPEIERAYNLSDNPKKRAICGISSGGICAFTAAWERPDYFQKVLSHIGSFTNIRGGHNYPALIRQHEAKPIKVFLQDGENDLDNRFGNWWLANLQMEAALKFKNYDYKFVADTGAHNGKHGGLILPQSLEWLWGDVVPSRLPSKKYGSDRPASASEELFSGATTHLEEISCQRQTILEGEEMEVGSAKDEQILIIQSGIAKVQIRDTSISVSKNSVIFVEVDENVVIASPSNDLQYLRIRMRSRADTPEVREEITGNSFVIDFDQLAYRENAKGGRRDFFRRSTRMFPYFEMHMTTLAPGFRSHPPHTHEAEELIIMVEGRTEEEIGNLTYQGTRGDIYYLGRNVPHGIKNIGKNSCTYFAFQWQ